MTAPQSTILALDLGTATGWALRTHDGQILSGTQSFKPGRYDGGGMRYLRFRAWLAELNTSAGLLGAIYFEEVRRHTGVDAAHVYGGLMATLTAWCEGQGIPYAGVPVGTIKKHATGKGNADKAAMVAAMQAKGHAPADDNEADALALLHLACASTAWVEQSPVKATPHASRRSARDQQQVSSRLEQITTAPPTSQPTQQPERETNALR